MFLYYTGSVDLDQPQTQIQKSLGGYKSSTRIPNSFLNNLFSDVSRKDSMDGDEVIIGVILKNETGSTVSDVTIYADVPSGSISSFEVSAVTLNNGKIEQIPNNSSIPYIGTLTNMSGLSNQVTLISELENQASIGLWIRRKIAKQSNSGCDALYTDYKLNGIPSKESSTEEVGLIIGWN